MSKNPYHDIPLIWQ